MQAKKISQTKNTGSSQSMNSTLFAKRLIRKYGLYLCQPDLQFYRYDGSQGIYIRVPKDVLESYIMEEVQRISPNEWNLKWHSNAVKAIELLAPKVKEFDTKKNLICLKNGVLNLKNFEFTKFSMKYYQTIKINIDYDPEADCPKFKKFLNEIFEGKDVKIWRRTAFEMFGYCISTETKADKFFLLLGSGANGKSTFLKVLINLCGKENYSTVSMEGLNRSFERLNLVGKTLNIIAEADITKGSLNSHYLKSIVTGDPISAEIKFGASFTFQPFCKFLIAANAMPPPEIDRTIGFARRFFVVPFNQQFLGKNASLNLVEELLEELPGILRYSILGLKRLRRNHYIFTGNELSKKFVEDYINNSNPIYEFIKDAIKPAPNNRIDNCYIFSAYQRWCIVIGENCNYSQRQFTIALKAALRAKNIRIEDKRSNGERQIQGIVIKKYIADEIIV